MKKILNVFILSFILILSNIGYCFASDETTVILNKSEYDILMDLNQLSNEELYDLGYLESDIIKIRDSIDIQKENVYNLKKLNESMLLEMGYNEEQVKIIKNFDGDTNDLMRVSATLSLDFTGKLTKGSNSSAYINVTFNWNGKPAISTYNALAVVNGEGMYYTIEKSSLKAENFDTASGKTTTYNIKPTMHGANNVGLSFKFKSNIPYSKTCYTKGGSAHIEMTKAKNLNEVGIRVAYAVSGSNINPSVSFPTSASISFSGGLKEVKSVFKILS